MKKKTVKNCVKKPMPKAVSCAAKVTPIKATLGNVIANPTILKNPRSLDFRQLELPLLKSLREETY